MAIDDNKLYDLKGSQLKDLSAKVKAKADQATTYTKTEVDNLIPDVSVLATKSEVSDGLALKADAATTYTKTEVDTALATKADTSTTYTKTEVDTALSAKADTATTYTKTEVDGLLTDKADKATTYTKTEVDGLIPDVSGFATKTELNTGLAGKADQATTYTKTEVDTELAGKQDTLVSGTNIKTVANQSLLGGGDVEFKTVNNSSISGSGNLNTGKVTADYQTNSVSIYEGTDSSVQISKDGSDAIRIQGYGEDDRGATQTLYDMSLPNKNYVDSRTGVNFAVGQETWYGTYTDENNVTYQVYTKTVYIPALPAAAGIETYPIGVTNMKQIISISGVTTDGFVLNAPRQTVTDNISIYQVSKGSQTFSIEVGKDRSSKKAYVTIIYAKNN